MHMLIFDGLLLALLDGRPIDCMLDTGASLTLISTTLWEAIRDKCVLSLFVTRDVSASGDPLRVQGRTEITLQFGNLQCPPKVIVAELEVDVVCFRHRFYAKPPSSHIYH